MRYIYSTPWGHAQIQITIDAPSLRESVEQMRRAKRLIESLVGRDLREPRLLIAPAAPRAA